MLPSETHIKRVVIENIPPEIEGGQFPIKRTVGEHVVVEGDIFADGHDAISALVRFRHEQDQAWTERAMVEIGHDRWRGTFRVEKPGTYHYTIEAWVNGFQSWYRALHRKTQAGLDVTPDLATGAAAFEQVLPRASPDDAQQLQQWAQLCRSEPDLPALLRDEKARTEIDARLMRYRTPEHSTMYWAPLNVVVDPLLARFGAWYEVFPRSCASAPGHHGTLRDLAQQLARIADMGFDVIYVPPIHPIGQTARKGRNNARRAQPGDPGSPWAVGSEAGGHKSIHPELGTLEDFQYLMAQARALHLEIALDIALQCSPDHPYVRSHPEWFRSGPDGSIQCAENPPHCYEDVYPFDFTSPQWPALWSELKSIFEFWVHQGVRVFRVDNPHTKPFAFWQWLIPALKRPWPELIFLSEGLTRPGPMTYLAKLGFTQSYDYFPWRNTKAELTAYYTRLTTGEQRQYFRPSLWPNTPQLLPPLLQSGGRPAFIMRFVLAATLGATYGIYGPAFEHCEDCAVGPGSVDYLDSEQYELRCWAWDAPGPLDDLIGHINRIRRSNPALESNDRLLFHPVDNDQLIAYSKTTADYRNVIVTIVNLDPHHTQRGFVDLRLGSLGLDADTPYLAHDLLTGARYTWQGPRNYVELDPQKLPAHLLRLEQPPPSDLPR